MPSDFPLKDPQKIWQNQPTEPLKMSASDLRRKALDRQSKSRFEALATIIIGIVLCVVWAWSFAKAHTMLARMGWGLLSLCGIYMAYHAYKWIWPGTLPEEAPISTCLGFYRRALERRRDYQHSWWRSGLPFFLLLGIVMAALIGHCDGCSGNWGTKRPAASNAECSPFLTGSSHMGCSFPPHEEETRAGESATRDRGVARV